MNNIENNIFNYATKELSQDAFICWLVSWIESKEKNEELYNVAYKFFRYIFKNNGIKNITNFEIEDLRKQEKNCDILIKLKNGYYIIIEDKIFTDEHKAGKTDKKQIEIYKEKIKTAEKIDDINKIITVYYKMIDEIEENANADVIINREIMLKEILNEDIKNDIYMDYKKHIQKLDLNIINIEQIPISKWTKSPELLYYFAKKNKEKLKNIEVNRSKGSIFFDWCFEEFNPKKKITTTMEFNKIHLFVDINYDKAIIGIRAKDVLGYSHEDRKKIEEELEKFFSEFKLGIKRYKAIKIKKDSSEYDSIGLLKIDITKYLGRDSDKLLYQDLLDMMIKIQKTLNKFVKENS